MSSNPQEGNFKSLNIAVLTSSDTREESNDKSGGYLAQVVQEAGHKLIEKTISPDNIYTLRMHISKWIADEKVNVILITGGTGVFLTDQTPEAVEVLYDKKIEGFGELFRMLSYNEIGTPSIQSRTTAGIANNTLIFVLPGSPNACKLGWSILEEQLDPTKKGCNFVSVLTKNSKK